MNRLLVALAILLALHPDVRAADRLACAVGGIVKPCPAGATLASGQKVAVGAVPTAIPAANIGAGAVDNTEFGYLDGVNAQITTINAAQILSNKSISGSANTLTNIPNSALTNSSITLTCTGMSGCGTVALGSTLSPAVTYGTTILTATQGNDARICPVSTGAGDTYYGTGSACAILLAGSTHRMLHANGAAATTWGLVDLATEVTGALPVANGGTGSATGDASSLTNLPAAQLTGSAPLASIATALAAGGGAVKGTVVTATTRVESPTIGTASGTQHALPAGTADLLSADSTATVTNKTLTAPVINGAVSGTITVATPSTGTAQPATALYAETVAAAAKTGGGAPTFYLTAAQFYTANGYFGFTGDGSSTTATAIAPWRVPAAGVLRDLTFYAPANAPSTLHFLLYRATTASTSPTYSATTLDATVTIGTNTGADNAHTVSVNAGDLILGFCNTLWAPGGSQLSFRYIPN